MSELRYPLFRFTQISPDLDKGKFDRYRLVMKLPDLEHEPDRVPIPETFHSFQHEGLFERCLVCDRAILEDNCFYLIEKAYREREVLFEYAICIDCRMKLQEEISRKSQERVAQYFGEHVDLVERQKHLKAHAPTQLEAWTDGCVITGKSKADAREFQLLTLCQGEEMLYGYLPYMICGEAMRGISSVLSKKTRERLDDFVDKYLGLPPGIRDLDLVL